MAAAADQCNVPGWDNYRQRDRTPDGPRYKSLGNSMAVNVMQWLGDRISIVEAMKVEVIEDELLANSARKRASEA